MSWLRIDDSFVEHPKFSGWTSSQRWHWLELMSWCARHRTDGRVPVRMPTDRQGRRTSELYAKAVESGLLDEVGDEMWIHDWALYNGDLAARVAAYCEKYPHAKANEVFRFSGGTRSTVLQLVREYRAGGTTSGTDRTASGVRAVDKSRRDVSQSGTESGSESGTGPHKGLRASRQASRSAVRRAREPSTSAEPAGLQGIAEEVEAFKREHGLIPEGGDDA